MDLYKAATDKPYGYLVIDLKPTTPDADRLQPNVLEDTLNRSVENRQVKLPPPTRSPELVKPSDTKAQEDLTMAEAQQILEELQQLRKAFKRNGTEAARYNLAPPPGKRLKRMSSTESNQSEPEPTTATMPSCTNCGAYYATWEDLKRHKKQNCPVTKNGKDRKKMTPEEERKLWHDLHVVNDAVEDTRGEFEDKVKEIMEEQGISEKKAQRMSHNELLPKLRKTYRQGLADYIIQMHKIQETDMYCKLMQTVEHLMEEEDFGQEEAIKQAFKQRKFMFDTLVEELDIESEESDEEREQSEAEEEDANDAKKTI